MTWPSHVKNGASRASPANGPAGADEADDARHRHAPDAERADSVGERRGRGGGGVARHRLSLFPEPGGADPGGGRRGARADPRMDFGFSPTPRSASRICSTFAYPRMDRYEATLRAALLLALDQWTRRQAGTLAREAPIVRGHRKALLRRALAPLRDRLDRKTLDRVTQSLSLIFGTEAFVVLKDIWGLDGEQARRVAIWAAHALVRAAVAEAATVGFRSRRSGESQSGTKTAQEGEWLNEQINRCRPAHRRQPLRRGRENKCSRGPCLECLPARRSPSPASRLRLRRS